MTPKKSVLITGCSKGGIGYALVRAFQLHGLTVFATARNLSKMSSLKELPNVILLELDVTSSADIAAAVKAVQSQSPGGKLDYLVNNSGRNYHRPTLDADIEEARRMFDVNFWGGLAMIQAFTPLLFNAQGTIVNIGSIVGYLYTPWSSTYNASKAALNIFSETLRLELQPLGIKVATVVTGAVASKIMENAPQDTLPPGSMYKSLEKELAEKRRGNDGASRMTSEELADRVVKDVLHGSTGLIWRGGSASITRWASAFFPRALVDRILIQTAGLDKMNPQKPSAT